MSRRNISNGSATTADGHAVTAIAYGEDEAKGAPSLANGGKLQLDIELNTGQLVRLEFERDEIAALVPTIVASAVRIESQADIAERYLREYGQDISPEQKTLLTGQMETVK